MEGVVWATLRPRQGVHGTLLGREKWVWGSRLYLLEMCIVFGNCLMHSGLEVSLSWVHKNEKCMFLEVVVVRAAAKCCC